MFEATLTILTGIIIAVISSIVTVWLSMRRFRSERSWDRAADTYAKLINALHRSKKYNDTHLAAAMRGSDLSKEKKEELRQTLRKAMNEIELIVDTGSFSLSQEAMIILGEYRRATKEDDPNWTWDEYLIHDSEATGKCLKKIIAEAKRDLRSR